MTARVAAVNQRTRAALTVAAGALATVVLYVRDPSKSFVLPPCPFHALTGKDCPGCGATRAYHQLLHGDLRGAFSYNPLAVLALPLFAYFGLRVVVHAMTGRTLPAITVKPWLLWTSVVMLIAFWIVRNMPWGPVAWMATYR